MSSPNQIPIIRPEFQIDKFDLGSQYGAPEDIVEKVATSILDSLVERDIDPDKVVFSGYNQPLSDHEKLAGEQRHNLKRLENPDLEALLGHEVEEERRQEWRSRPTIPEYFFAAREHLFAPRDSDVNPIHFAGTGKGASIDVFDAATLQKLDGVKAGKFAADAISIRALTHQILPARVAGIKLAYKPLKHTKSTHYVTPDEWRQRG